MKLKLLLSCILVLCSASIATAQSPHQQPLRSSTQIVVVTTPDWTTVEGRLQRYERTQANKRWKRVGNAIAIVVGKNGLGWGAGLIPTDSPSTRSPQDPVKKEGDGKSPAGIFRLSAAFGSEHMLQAGEAYRWGVVVDHNANPAVPAAGSCIFLHIWAGRGIGTTGCTAMPQELLEPILAWLDPARNPLLVQLPLAQYKKLRGHWHLPRLPKP